MKCSVLHDPIGLVGGRIRGSHHSYAFSVVAALGLGALGVAVLRRLLIIVETVGSSMEPTYTSGTRLLVVRGTEARRGQVVVLEHQGRDARQRPPGASAYLVKRVAALPGDPVPPNVRAVVHVDVVPPGQCVVLGDNADSVDSRVWGFVPQADVVGRVVRVLRPGVHRRPAA